MAICGHRGAAAAGVARCDAGLVPADLLGVAYSVQEAVPTPRLAPRAERDDRPRSRLLPAPAPSRAAVPASGHRGVRADLSALRLRGPGISGSRFPPQAVLNAFFVLLIVRVGLLAAVVTFYVSGLFIFFPVTGNLRAWYAGAGVTALLVLAALALFGFTTALAGRPALGRADALDA